MSAPAVQPLSAASSPVLSVRGLAHRFGERQALQGLDFDLRQGEIFGLLGPNGCGKSTAISVLAGLRPRQGGTVLWQGRELAEADRSFRARLGVVFQSPAVDPKLTGRQNLLLAGRVHGFGRRVRHERAASGLQAAGLVERANDLVGEYSGGMKRRLDLARALLHEPELLVMDEPTAGLDEASFRETWSRLEAMRAGRDVTILVATHRPDEAARCDRLAVISQGRVAAVETPRELQARVAEDVVVLRADDPELLQAEVREKFGLECLRDGEELVVEVERGHELIPRLVEGLPDGRLVSVGLRHPTLADAFFRIAGQRLDRDLEAVEPARASKGKAS